MYAMHADGGGSPAEGLSMNEVLNGNPGYSTRVLYADLIDASAVSAIIDNLYNSTSGDGIGSTTATLIDDNNTMMAASNSERFYTGSRAQSHFSAMDDVKTKLLDLIDNIDHIYDDKSTILSKIEEYNTKLMELKKDCRIKLLRDAADAWNLEKHEEKRTSVYGQTTYPQKDVVWGDAQYVKSEPINISSSTAGNSAAESYVVYSYTRVYYKIIKYWRGLKNCHLLKDPGFAEVEAMFHEVGAPLPYNISAIRPQ